MKRSFIWIWLLISNIERLWGIHCQRSYLIEKNVDYSTNLTYAIALTTIPPRFKYIQSTLRSWLNQVYEPTRICVYIPINYRRFKLKDGRLKQNYSELLHKKLLESPDLATATSKQKIKLLQVSRDWGPITKLIGVALEFRRFSKFNQQRCFFSSDYLPDFWLFGDDDVAYSPYTVLKYHHHLTFQHNIDRRILSSDLFYPFVLTQFVETYRIYYYLSPEREGLPIIPRHIQAVDSYLFPSAIFDSDFSNKSILHDSLIQNIVRKFHNELCPESFYQDDYIVSFLLSLLNITIFSIWNNDKLTIHIDNVSLDHYQMHRDPKVFERESNTKACIYTYANIIFSECLQQAMETK